MSDKSEGPPSPDGQPASDRKITKPLMEKRRRARINSCLTELKTLLLTDVDENESSRFAKLEKADILEMTVKYLRARQHVATNGQHTAMYRAGFNKCMDELSAFLGTDKHHSANLRLKLTTHLAEILCSMDGLKDTGSKFQVETEDNSPGFQVSSSSDEPRSEPGSPALTLQRRSDPCPPAAEPSTTKETAQPGVTSPSSPFTVKTDCFSNRTSVYPVVEGANTSASNIPLTAYTTIPLLPTMLTQGQVLLLVPNGNGTRVGFQLPTLASSNIRQLAHAQDQIVSIPGNPVKNEPIVSAPPVKDSMLHFQDGTGKRDHTSQCASAASDVMKREANCSAYSVLQVPISKTNTDNIQSKSPGSEKSTAATHTENPHEREVEDGSVAHSSVDCQRSMWRPW